MSSGYFSVIQQHPNTRLFDICHQFLDQDQQRALLFDILTEQVSDLEPWINFGQSSFEIAFNSPANLAFQLLLQQPKFWLNSHHLFFESKLNWSLSAGDQGDMVWQKIKSLLEETRSGLTRQGISDILQNPSVTPLPETAELELHLMLIKITEDTTHPHQWHEFWEEKWFDKPLLITALIYAYRNIDPLKAISMLKEWDGQFSQYPTPLTIPEKRRQYTVVYLRHALYNLLHNATKDKFIEFRSLMDSLHEPVLRQMLEETLRHELLTDIAEAYDLSNQFGVSEDAWSKLNQKIDENDDML